MRECAETRNVVVERHLHLDSVSHEVFNFAERFQVVLGHDIITIRRVHPGNEASERRDAISLPDAEDRGINVSGTSLESSVRVCNRAASVVVEVSFNVAADHTAKRADQIVNLTWVCNTDSVGNTNAVDTDLVDGLVNAEQVYQIRPERVFRRKADVDAMRLDKLNHFDSGLGNVGHVLAVRELPQELGCSHDDVDTVDTSLNCYPGIIHVAANVGENLGFEAELADRLAVLAGLLRGGRRGELDAVDAKVIKRPGNFDLGFGVKKSVGELLTLCE